MRLPLFCLLGSCLTFSAAAADQRVFFTREIGSIAQCHTEYDAWDNGWRHHRSFKVSGISNGRERVIHCLKDGVVESVCNPEGGKLAVAVVEGATMEGCQGFSPGVPAIVKQSLLLRSIDNGVASEKGRE